MTKSNIVVSNQEKILERANKRIEKFFFSSFIPMMFTNNNEDATINDANVALVSFLDQKQEKDILGKSWFAFLNNEGRCLIKKRRIEMLSGNLKLTPIKLTILNSKKSTVQFQEQPININNKIVWSAVISPIDELMKFEKELIETNARMDLFFRQYLLPVFICDSDDGTILDTNVAASDLFRCNISDIIGRNIKNILCNKFKYKLKNLKEEKTFRAKIIDTDTNANNWAQLDVKVHNNLTIIHVTDISNIKQHEAILKNYHLQLENEIKTITDKLKKNNKKRIQDERFATIGKVTSVVAHELRNPLGTIRNTIHRLEIINTKNKLGINNDINRLVRNIERCNLIIQDLLDFTRMTAITPAQSNKLSNVITSIVNDFENKYDIEIFSTIKTKQFYIIDENKIRQLIENILQNAIEASLHLKSPKIKISAIDMSSSVHIKIFNYGGGISEEDRLRIFEPLFSTKGFGIGLGLSICKTIIKAHNGTIEHKNINDGVEFLIKIPKIIDTVQSKYYHDKYVDQNVDGIL